MYQDWDMLFLLEGGKRLLAGGTYVNDMFENNPPLIYYFSVGINFLAKAFDVSNVFVFKLFIYILILYSLGACHYLLNFKPVKSIGISFLLLTLAFCLLILSVCVFGEREHLMLILTMPYYFLLYQSAAGIKFNPTLKITISFLAALGFAIKPYFLFSFLFSELLFMYWQRNWKALFRLEIQIIFWTLIAYLVSITVFMPDFYSDILPYLIKFYVFNTSIIELLTNPALINAALLLLSSLYLSAFLGRIETLLIAVNSGCILSFILQGKGWYYHAFPLITMNSLLATMLVFHLLTARKRNKIHPLLLMVIIIAQILFTLIPAFVDDYKRINYYKNDSSSFQQFIKITRKFAHHKPIFFFSTDLAMTLPIVYYSNAKLGSRFPSLWPLAGIINRQYALQHCDQICREAKQKILHYIMEDFKRYQPELAYVDVHPYKTFIKPPFEYLKFMQQSPDFQIIWQQYCYLLTSRNYAIYHRCKKGGG